VPHRTRCRFFRDSDVEDEVLWYPALPDAEMLPYPSMIGNSYLDPDGVFFLPGGEVYGAEKIFSPEQQKPGALGGHVCGTETDFREGCLFLPDEPPVTYRTDGLPTCCGAAVDRAGGGAGGGRDLVVLNNPIVPGNTCVTASLVPLSTWVTYFIPAGATAWIANQPPGVASSRKMFVENVSGATTVEFRFGFCPSPVSLGSAALPTDIVYGGSGGGEKLFLLPQVLGTDQTIRVRVEPFP